MAKFEKWEKLWQDGKNEYLRKSHISTEILRTILTKGKTGKTLYRIIDSDDRLFYEGIVNLRITCTTSDIDKLMYISNGVGRKSVAVVEFSKDTLSYEMQKTDSRWTDESEHLVFGKFKVSKKSDEIYISGCDIPLIHFYAEPIDQSVDYAKKLIQKRIGHYKEDPLAKQLNDEAILKMFKESTNYNKSIRFEENTMRTYWDKFFENVKDESIYNAHAQYEKDQLKKKEEEDNQENFTFDEGSVKLATIVKESDERKYWNNFFDNLTESVDDDNAMFMGYINNLFNDEEIGRCPECGMAITDEDELEDGSHECPKCGSILEDHGPSTDFWDIEDDE